jgi:hypothetical protein
LLPPEDVLQSIGFDETMREFHRSLHFQVAIENVPEECAYDSYLEKSAVAFRGRRG